MLKWQNNASETLNAYCRTLNARIK